MAWMSMDNGTPVYLQIMNDIRRRIISGQWPPGIRIPAVRELAIEFGVNPNTMQRALSELEREGLVYSERTSGRYITEDAALIADLRGRMAAESAGIFLLHMQAMKFTLAEIISILETAEQEK